MSEGNREKTASAPLVAILAAMTQTSTSTFRGSFPMSQDEGRVLRSYGGPRADRCRFNSSLQIAYFILGVRAAGLAAAPWAGSTPRASTQTSSPTVITESTRRHEHRQARCRRMAPPLPSPGVRRSGHDRLTQRTVPVAVVLDHLSVRAGQRLGGWSRRRERPPRRRPFVTRKHDAVADEAGSRRRGTSISGRWWRQSLPGLGVDEQGTRAGPREPGGHQRQPQRRPTENAVSGGGHEPDPRPCGRTVRLPWFPPVTMLRPGGDAAAARPGRTRGPAGTGASGADAVRSGPRGRARVPPGAV